MLPAETTYSTYMLYTTLDLSPQNLGGEYILSLRSIEPTPIEVGETVTREISDPSGDFTSFQGVAGDVVCIRGLQSGMATDFVLYSPDYSVVERVGGCYRLPETGPYITALYSTVPYPNPGTYSFSLYYESVP
jgi:hypothetical protein